ncbi:MAG: hypothetical protein JJT76_11760 [Clostridiaceae bacterium]|nr:hypothetical protein [Clostridiaceae bacterium]
MNQETVKDLGHMAYANLNQEQLKQLMVIEDEINKNRQNKVYLMAMIDEK